MSGEQLLKLWSDSVAVSSLIWLVIVVAALYLARRPAHEMILAFSRAIHRAMRLAANSVMKAEQRAVRRNREVLLAMAEENQSRFIEREFHRVNAVVNRDLSGYPALHRQLSEEMTRIDEDYRESTEVPPSPPAWLDAVEAVAKIPSSDPVVANILEDIHGTLEKASHDAIEEYRAASQKRHMYLKRMMPYWRGISNTLDDVQKTITGLQERAQVIDTQMERFEEMRAKTDRMVNTLSASATKQFFIDGLVMLIAVLGGYLNFYLIARPMSEMVGATARIGAVNVSDIAALVIIAVEIAMGLFLMESLRITRLFPVIGSLDDKMRRRMIWVTFSILFILASVEAGLAYMRDLLAAQDEALKTQLTEAMRGGELGAAAMEAPAFRWIPSLAQMIMGFILPFALAFVAIPLESFVHSARTVFGALYAAILRGVAFLLRLIGNVFRGLGGFVVHLYDLLIFLPLGVERLIKHTRHAGVAEEAPTAQLAAEGATALPSPSKSRQSRKQGSEAS